MCRCSSKAVSDATVSLQSRKHTHRLSVFIILAADFWQDDLLHALKTLGPYVLGSESAAAAAHEAAEVSDNHRTRLGCIDLTQGDDSSRSRGWNTFESNSTNLCIPTPKKRSSCAGKCDLFSGSQVHTIANQTEVPGHEPFHPLARGA